MVHSRRATNKLTFKFTVLAELTLFTRFVFSLLDADKSNSFVQWVYSMTETLLAPIRGVFPAESFDHRFVLEFRVLFAMAFYSLLACLVLVLLHVLPKPKVDKFNRDKIRNWQRTK